MVVACIVVVNIKIQHDFATKYVILRQNVKFLTDTLGRLSVNTTIHVCRNVGQYLNGQNLLA